MLMIFMAVQLMVLPLYMITWFAIRQERLQLKRQYKAAVARIQLRG